MHYHGLGQSTAAEGTGSTTAVGEDSPMYRESSTGLCFKPLFPFVGRNFLYTPNQDWMTDYEPYERCRMPILDGPMCDGIGGGVACGLASIAVTGLLAFWLLSGGSK